MSIVGADNQYVDVAESAERSQKWTSIIERRTKLLDFRLRELWEYRDLLLLLVKRDYIAFYAQTVLGPLWFFIQPLMTMAMYVLVFNGIAGIKTDPIPAPLFYVAGIVFWNYFADCVNKTSTVFRDNSSVFGKVYFPRLIVPISIVLSCLVRFGIQLLLLGAIIGGYAAFGGYAFHFTSYAALFPLCVLLIALYALGLGMIVSSLTTKYRDLAFLITFGIQLYMYATPVIYPLPYPQNPVVRQIIGLNPLSPIFETVRLGLLGSGYFQWSSLIYSAVVVLACTLVGIVIFNKTQNDFIDTV
jgi:lipopolysaccharide transport system permease protein